MDDKTYWFVTIGWFILVIVAIMILYTLVFQEGIVEDVNNRDASEYCIEQISGVIEKDIVIIGVMSSYNFTYSNYSIVECCCTRGMQKTGICVCGKDVK